MKIREDEEGTLLDYYNGCNNSTVHMLISLTQLELDVSSSSKKQLYKMNDQKLCD